MSLWSLCMGSSSELFKGCSVPFFPVGITGWVGFRPGMTTSVESFASWHPEFRMLCDGVKSSSPDNSSVKNSSIVSEPSKSMGSWEAMCSSEAVWSVLGDSVSETGILLEFAIGVSVEFLDNGVETSCGGRETWMGWFSAVVGCSLGGIWLVEGRSLGA